MSDMCSKQVQCIAHHTCPCTAVIAVVRLTGPVCAHSLLPCCCAASRSSVSHVLRIVYIVRPCAAAMLLCDLQVQYVPKFFFGALLLWFGVEIVKDWLFESMK